MSHATYTKRDFDDYCKRHHVKPVAVYAYLDSSGEENLFVLDDRLDWEQKIQRLHRFINDAEATADEIAKKVQKKLVSLQKKR